VKEKELAKRSSRGFGGPRVRYGLGGKIGSAARLGSLGRAANSHGHHDLFLDGHLDGLALDPKTKNDMIGERRTWALPLTAGAVYTATKKLDEALDAALPLQLLEAMGADVDGPGLGELVLGLLFRVPLSLPTGVGTGCSGIGVGDLTLLKWTRLVARD
jgi:hypothetical protein